MVSLVTSRAGQLGDDLPARENQHAMADLRELLVVG